MYHALHAATHVANGAGVFDRYNKRTAAPDPYSGQISRSWHEGQACSAAVVWRQSATQQPALTNAPCYCWYLQDPDGSTPSHQCIARNRRLQTDACLSYQTIRRKLGGWLKPKVATTVATINWCMHAVMDAAACPKLLHHTNSRNAKRKLRPLAANAITLHFAAAAQHGGPCASLVDVSSTSLTQLHARMLNDVQGCSKHAAGHMLSV
jgi:hypothetical protein